MKEKTIYIQIYKLTHRILYSNVFLFSCFFIALALLIYRAFFGLDWSDEGGYTAISYRFALGDKLFVDSWDITQLSAILTAPFCWLYFKIVGDTTGIILFMRILFICFLSCAGVYLFKSISKTFGRVAGYCVTGIFLFFVPFGIGTFSYNTLSYIFNICISISLLNALNCNNQKLRYKYLFWSGILLSLCVLSYPTYLICSILYVGLVFFLFKGDCQKNTKRFISLSWFLLGVTIIFIFFIIYVSLTSGFHDTFINISRLFTDEAHIRQSFINELNNAINLFFEAIPYKKILGLSFIGLFVISFIKFKKIDFKLFSQIVLLIITISLAMYHFIPIKNSTSINLFVLFVGIVAPLMFVISPTKNGLKIILLLWLPSFVGSIAVYCGTNNGFRGASYAMLGAVLASILLPFICYRQKKTNCKNIVDNIYIIILFLCATTIIFSFIVMRFEVVYRDVPVLKATTQLKSGPYKGIYTTEKNAEIYEKIVSDIKIVTKNASSVTYCAYMPLAYLCTDKKISSHTVYWIHQDSERIIDYYTINKPHKPDLIVLFNQDIGIQNSIPKNTRLYLVEYIEQNKIGETDYKYFKAYKMKP